MTKIRPQPTVGPWVELRCTLPAIWADLIAEWLLEERTSGVLVEDGDGELAGPAGRVTLITALPDEADVASVVEQLRALGRSLAARSGLKEGLSVKTRPIEPEQLEALLAPSFKPLELAGGLWVVPAHDDGAEGDVPPGSTTIQLIPGLAFGTGSHPSTRLAARLAAAWFDRLPGGSGPRVLELGTGSGLLAIAAALRGASLVVGVEKDLMALENARRNAALNGVGPNVAFIAADLTTMEPRGWANLLLANLDRDHFQRGSDRLAGWLEKGGAMVASGVRVEHEGPVLESLRAAGLAIVERADEGPWVAHLAERRQGG
jgi:ribosomal protein L11 methyltransferase